VTLIVCPLHDLDALVVRETPARIVSLLSPDPPPPGARPDAPSGTPRLLLQFHDIAEPRKGLVPPDLAAIDALLAFGAAWTEPGPMAVHCWAGISRSTAAALILACTLDPGRDERAAAEALRAASPTATPNRLMIALADARLGRHGRLVGAAAAIGRGAEAMCGEPFRYPVRACASQ
jgi:predicted protein tyrosine phosphatase